MQKESPWTGSVQVATYREQKKLADKQRKLQEKAHRIKEDSLRDDDNVFDVAFENQGGDAAEHTVSATDIKASGIATLSVIATFVSSAVPHISHANHAPLALSSTLSRPSMIMQSPCGHVICHFYCSIPKGCVANT